MRQLGMALAAVILLFSASPVFADSITNTFTGVVASDSTTDLGQFFSGDPTTNLAGNAFSMIFSYTANPGDTLVFNGVGTLSINGQTQTLGDSGDVFLSPVYGTDGVTQIATDIVFQAFSNAGQALGVDLNVIIPITQDLSGPLPSMFAGANTFTPNAANFTDSGTGENLDLTVQAVNVPEPSTLMLLVAGLIGLGVMLRRNAA